MSTTMTPMPAAAPGMNITDKTVALNLTFGRVGNSKKVPKSQIQEKAAGDATPTQDCAVEVDADKNLVGVSKRLLKSKELADIQSHDSEVAQWVKDRSVPSMFRRGIYLVKIEAVQQIEEYLQAAAAKRADLIAKFLAVYDKQKAEAEQHLRGVYDPQDYPPKGVVAATFVFEWSYITFATPAKLKEISSDFFEKERAKAEAKWSQATEEAKLLLRAQMKDLVDHLLERLEPGEDGKKKIFKSSTVSNIATFLENFKIRNVTDDAEMELLVGNAQKLLSNIDPKDLRENEAVRSNMAAGFGMVKTFLDQMVETAGSRKIVLEEEPETEESIF